MSTGNASLLGVSVLELRTDDRQLRSGLAQAEREADASGGRVAKTFDKHMSSVGQSMQRTGSTLSTHLTLPIVAAFGAAGDAAVKFQSQMEMIHTQAGAAQVEVDKMSKSVLAFAESGKAAQAPQQLADGLFHLESVGLRGAKAMDALKIASEGAAVGHADLEQTATALGAAWLVNIKGAGDLQQTMGILNATVGAGNMKMQDLVDALGTGVLAASKQAGLSIQDVMGALAVFTDEGYNASSAAAQLGTAYHFLTNPTTKAADALKSVGLTSTSLATDMHKPEGLLTALRDLKAHLDSLPGGIHGVQATQILGDILPGGRGRILEVLLNQLDRYQMKLGQISTTSSQFSQDVAATQQTAAFRIHAAWSQVQADAVQFGDVVLPKLLSAGHTILSEGEKVASAFFGLPKGAQDAIITGGLITAGIGPAMKLLGAFSTVIGKAWQLGSILTKVGMGQGMGAFHSAGSAAESLAGGLMGVRGTSVGAGSEANPIATVLMDARYTPLGSKAAQVGTSEQVSSFNPARGSSSTSAVPVGPAAGAGTLVEGEAAAAETSMLASLKSGLSTVLGRGMQGLLIGGVGTLASQAIGSAIHGSVGAAISQIGSDASIGAGFGAIFGPPGIAGGAIIGGLYGTFEHFIANDAARQGREFADKFTAPMGPAVTKSTKDAVAKATTAAVTATADSHNQIALQNYNGPNRFGVNPSSPASSAQAAGLFNQQFNADFKQGQAAGQAFVQGFSAVKFKTIPAFLMDATLELGKLKGTARNEAAATMITYAQSLESHGQLPKGATDQIIRALERQYAGLGAFLNAQGKNNSATIKATMKWDGAVSNLTSAESKVRAEFGLWETDPTINGGNVITAFQSEMSQLKDIAAHTTGAAHDAALLEMDALKKDAHGVLVGMVNDFQAQTGAMSDTLAHGPHNKKWADAVGQALGNFSHFVSGVGTLMGGGVATMDQGSDAIYKAIVAMMNSFGGKPPNAPQLGVASVEAGVVAGAQQAVGIVGNILNLPGHATGGMVQKPMVMVGEEAPTHPEIVLASNPAYRERNLGLWAQAGQMLGVPGFAQGGIIGYAGLEGLWNQAGGPPADAALMAAIALAESGGNPSIVNSIGASGLWQIHPAQPGDLDPLTNARMAVAKFLSQGLGAWEAYTNGSYKQFLNGAVPPGATGAASFTPVKAPKVTGGGTVGDIAQGALNKVADAANSWAMAHMPAATGGGPGGGVPFTHGQFTFPLPQGSWTPGQIDQGWDLAAPGHTPLYAIADGTITGHGISGFGPWAPILTLDSMGGVRVYYGHAGPGGELPDNTHVHAGQVIGEVGAGDVGQSTGPHLEIGWYPVGGFGAGSSMKKALGYAKGGIIGRAADGLTRGTRKPATGVPAKQKPFPKTKKTAHPKTKKVIETDAGIAATDTKAINRGLGQLDGILGTDGSVAKLTDLLSYWQQTWQIDPGQLTYVVTQDALGNNITPFIDQAAVNEGISELSQQVGWETTIVGDLRTALAVARMAIAAIKKAIAKRQREIAAKQARIKANVKKIAALQKLVDAEHKKPHPSKTMLDGWSGQIKSLKDENQKLGGDPGKVGTAGEIGPLQKQVQSLQTSLQTAQAYPDQIAGAGATGFGGQLSSAVIAQAQLEQQLGQLSPTALNDALAKAQASGSATDNSTLISLLQQQVTSEAQENAVLSATMRALGGNLPPFGGTFHSGGIVPGPVGAERMALVQAGERITPVGGDGGSISEHRVIVEPKGALNDLVDVRIEQRTRTMSRNAGRMLPGAGGGGIR